MEIQEVYQKIMAEQKLIGLATSVATTPHVRIVRFTYDKDSGKIYFTTVKGTAKTLEFAQNQQVAFTTIPQTGYFEHVRSIGAIVKKSQRSIEEVKEAFIEKDPSFEIILAQAGPYLEVYEIPCRQFLVALDYQRSETITL